MLTSTYCALHFVFDKVADDGFTVLHVHGASTVAVAVFETALVPAVGVVKAGFAVKQSVLV